MLHSVEKHMVIVSVDGERISQEVYVDASTGLDVDPQTGVFRTRAETEKLIREVYLIARDALPTELERYNKWMRGGSRAGLSQPFLQHALPTVAGTVTSDGIPTKPEKTAEYRARGNDAMRRGDLRKALRWYSEALQCEPASSTLWSNKAAAMVQLGRGDAALSDAEKAISLDPTNIKAYYRKASALYLLGARAAAARCVKDSVKQFGTDVAWESLERRIVSMARAVLVDDRWICSEAVEGGEELCTLQGIKLPSVDPSEVLQLWAEDGVPAAVLTAEAAYYAARGSRPLLEPYDGIIAAQRVYDTCTDADSECVVASRLADLLRWRCLLLGSADPQTPMDTRPWLEHIFGDGFIFLGASFFFSPLPEANVLLCFDAASHVLRVVARRHIGQYETLSSLSASCC
ncbi:mitochondrial import receptor subunit [Trypanosoma rangeli]|uniref:Mitochondrial import receptor subunit n=1 Tax=Trypanosoma rangeli TaxID=5698 RepID=A0A3R7RMC0_TRYRA|nr:mitochondrial import receptor subunit [Trypanosoma rangeli]RNF06988.1 mitochondrial import receptor subunit [Trypanosoma rangeli]|eukprot:RNF06988.1 mitochondrial import receptor subunit [Trypanosoma rangeli]